MAAAVDTNLVLRDQAKVLQVYRDVPEVAFDLETGGLRPNSDSVHVVSLAAPGVPPAVLHVRHYLDDELVGFLSTKHLVGHNLTTFDVPFMWKYGLHPSAVSWDDTLVLEQLAIVTNRRGVSKSLQASLSRRTGKRISKSADHSAWGADTLDEAQVRYCADDVSHVLRLRDEQVAKVRELGVEDALELERSVHPAVAWMTVNGVPLDTEGLLQNTGECLVEAMNLLREIGDQYGLANPNSHVQVKDAAHRLLGVRPASTDHTTLTNWTMEGGEKAQFADRIIRYRALTKAAMYDEEWLSDYAPDGRCYPNYWQLGTDTGRMSCSNPNIQQWPSRMRRFVRARPGYSITSADLSQVEIVVAAVLYKDPALLAAVKSEDVHTAVAALIFDRDPSDPDVGPGSRLRKISKAASFTFLFAGGLPGMRAATLGEGIPDEQLVDAQRKFNARFPTFYRALGGYQRQVYAGQASRTGLHVKPKRGPVRFLWGPDLTTQRVVNSLVQGSAASILKRALALCLDNGLGPYLCTAIHDEIALEVPKDRTTWAEQALEDAMSRAAIEVINHPVRVKVRSGQTLAD